jgi:NAD(P)-dependent dehydrogenase (short-subunit alcohol dehydrogenase family)
MKSNALSLSATIEGRTALVTGGARGIGEATVEALLACGANVALTYNRAAAEAARLAERWPLRASYHFLDLRDRRSIQRCFAEVEERWGPLHIVVQNAAVGSATVEDYEPSAERRDQALIEINAIGAFWVCREAVLALRRASDGRACKLIILASVGGLQIFPSMRLADNMSKSAVVYMARQLSAELAQTHVDVFAVCPGATDTDMFQRSTLRKLRAEERQALVSRMPKRRLIEPSEIADVIVFLASACSSVLHGAVLDASLGLGVHPGLLTGEPRS